ncbi:MAG: DUF29 domain-containing protein [Xenococcus sp. (in: cyanobacteria)]
MDTIKIPPKFKDSIYEQDYYLWLQTTVHQLKQGDFSAIEMNYLIEELESMGRKEKNALSSNLQVLLMHLLKYKYQPEKRSNSWRFTIYEHRDRLIELFEESPSLKSYFEEVLNKCYGKARTKASIETGMNIELLPTKLPFTLEEILNTEYLPD